MKKIINFFIGGALAVGLNSCSEDFLTYTPSNGLPSDGFYQNANDVQNSLIGAYYALGSAEFAGRNVIALGDLASDVAYMDGSSGHLQAIYDYSITEQLADLEDIWKVGYQVIDRTTRTINGGKLVLGKTTNESEKKAINYAIAQSYGLRAYSSFILANIFGLPYSTSNASSLGIIIVDKQPIELFQKIERSTLQKTYEQILADIASAKTYFANGTQTSGYMFGYAALCALEARVHLYMGNDDNAITAANNALASMDKGIVILDKTKYTDMWGSTALTSEDIFTIAKTESDNLSANSLNTLYATYGGFMTEQQMALYADDDMRTGLFFFDNQNQGWRAQKYQGTSTSKSVSNIRIFSIPEMYLILAEAYAHKNMITEAQTNLLNVAKRNPAIDGIDKLPSTKDALLAFIMDERAREFFQEGHRWFDLRRTGSQLQRTTGPSTIENYDVFKFAYPVPAYEINASGIQQNPNWANNLPE